MIHGHVVIAVALAGAVVLLLVFRRDRAPAGPVYVTRRSPVAGLGILLAGVAAVIYARKHQAPPAGSALRQNPVVTRTVTQQVTRYVPLHNWPVSGLELTLLGLGVIAAAVVIVRLTGRYFGR